jgi:hypothetical protein
MISLRAFVLNFNYLRRCEVEEGDPRCLWGLINICRAGLSKTPKLFRDQAQCRNGFFRSQLAGAWLSRFVSFQSGCLELVPPSSLAGIAFARPGLHCYEKARSMTESTGKSTESCVARQQSVERITIALIPKAGEDLQRIQDRTGLSKTDIVNRAISVYEFLEDQIESGCDLLIRDKRTGEIQLIRFL